MESGHRYLGKISYPKHGANQIIHSYYTLTYFAYCESKERWDPFIFRRVKGRAYTVNRYYFGLGLSLVLVVVIDDSLLGIAGKASCAHCQRIENSSVSTELIVYS
jgi:hypothetical protein